MSQRLVFKLNGNQVPPKHAILPREKKHYVTFSPKCSENQTVHQKPDLVGKPQR